MLFSHSVRADAFLWLSRNQVTELPVELSKLPALTQLKAHHNHLKALPKWFV